MDLWMFVIVIKEAFKTAELNNLQCSYVRIWQTSGGLLSLVTWLVVAVLLADTLFKKRLEKADFIAPGPHVIEPEKAQTEFRNICSHYLNQSRVVVLSIMCAMC